MESYTIGKLEMHADGLSARRDKETKKAIFKHFKTLVCPDYAQDCFAGKVRNRGAAAVLQLFFLSFFSFLGADT